MAKCSFCSAPLAANTNKCSYCGARNDVDLNNKHTYSIVRKETGLLCPNCEDSLQTIDLNLDGAFLIERCSTCFGLFINPEKIETLLEKSVPPVFDVNLQQLDAINQERFPADKEVKYLKCPVCQTFMSRNVFAYRSGVIVDRCKNHGIWLDSGEITHLMEWKKTGGQLLHEQQKSFENRSGVEQRPTSTDSNSLSGYPGISIQDEFLDTVASLLEKIFD